MLMLKGFGLAVAAVTLTASLALWGGDGNSIRGSVRVIDGDTIEFTNSGKRLRLTAIDAPEARQPCRDAQPCGLMAAAHLIELIDHKTVTCTVEPERDVYKRLLGECTVAGATRPLNLAMVADGYAIDYSRRSQPAKYFYAEQNARHHHFGLWAHGGFEIPVVYRHAQER
jgi:endonuclease YncB( thermonuclease family)